MHLFDSISIREVTLRNRIVVSPMCQYSSKDGFADDWHLVHLGSRAIGGAGLIITEATAVTPDGRISPGDLGIWKDEHVPNLRRIVEFLHVHGSKAGIQLAHAGFKASVAAPFDGGQPLSPKDGGWTPIFAPSALAFSDGYQTATALDKVGIKNIIESFKKAAERAVSAGFDVIELHGAHGYLGHEFLSPITNHRTDEYGGSLENRIRFACEITAAVRQIWPASKPLFFRVSASDWMEGGWDLAQSIALAKALKPLGVDVIDCSSGGISLKARIPIGPGYQVKFAEEIRRDADIMTCAVGMITTATQADTVVRSGQADLVTMAREFLRQPYWPLQAAKDLGTEVAWPKQYERAKR